MYSLVLPCFAMYNCVAIQKAINVYYHVSPCIGLYYHVYSGIAGIAMCYHVLRRKAKYCHVFTCITMYRHV